MKTFKRIKIAWKYIFDDDWRMAKINDDGSLIFDFIHSDGSNFKILYLDRQTDSMRRLNNLGTKWEKILQDKKNYKNQKTIEKTYL